MTSPAVHSTPRNDLPPNSSTQTGTARFLRAILIVIAYSIAYHLLDRTAAAFQGSHGISIWYAPLGLSVALLLWFGVGYAPVYFAATLISSKLVWGDVAPADWLTNAGLALIPVSVYSLSAWLLRHRFRLDLRFEELRSMLVLCTAAMTASMLVALGYVFAKYSLGAIPADHVWSAIRDFWIGDVIAQLSFVPFLLTIVFPWTSAVIRYLRSPERQLNAAIKRLIPRVATTILWFGFVVLVIWYSFNTGGTQSSPVLYPCFVPLIFAAFWRGTKGASTGVLSVCGAVALLGNRSFEQQHPQELQLFLVAVSLTTLFLGAALTAHKRAIEDLENVHGFYREAISAARAVPYVRDYDSNAFTYVGDGIEGVTGFKPNEFTPTLWEERSRVSNVVGEAAGLEAPDAIRRTRSGEFKTWSSEGRFLARDGSLKWFSDASVEIFGPDGRPVRSIGLIQDISQYKEAETALRETQEHQRLILSSLPVCFYSGQWDKTYEAIWLNDSIESITGFPRHAFEGKSDLWRRRIHPDDVEPTQREFDQVVRLGRASAEFRWQHADGSYRWIWNQLVRIPPEKGQLPHIVGFWLDITDRKRAEEALKASRAVLYSFVENTPAAVAMLDRDMRYMVVSRRWLHDYRLGERDIIGQSHYDVFPEIRQNEDWRSIHQQCLNGAVLKRDEDRFIRADGAEEWLRWEIRPWLDDDGAIGGIIMFTEVITERKRAQEILRKSEERLELALRGADMGMWDLDVRSGELAVHSNWLHRLGYDETAPRDVNWWTSMTHPDDLETVTTAIWENVSGSRPFFDIEFRTKNRAGDWLWAHTRGRVVEWSDGQVPARVMGTLLDITSRKEAEEERQQLEMQMQHAQKLESLGILAGGIAHDFNNLLVGILGNADLALVDLPKQSSVRESLQAIVTSAQRAADLCRQMLAYSGRGRFVIMPVSMNDLVQEMAQLLAVSVFKGINVNYALAPTVPAIEADPTQLRQIVMNLLTNASEAIGDTEGVVRITTGVTVWNKLGTGISSFGADLVDGDSYVFLRISDTGCGMDPATIQRIFDPFFTTKFTGRGLGMAAVLGIVRGHSGAITVESAPGRGSTFTVLLPAVSAPVETPRPARKEEPIFIGSGMVLVVDDEEPVLQIARHMLERRGFTALTARNGREALETFAKHKDNIRLAVVDLTMPRMSGAQLLDELHAMKPDLRVVLSSGYNEQEAIAQSHGKMSAFIQKPYRAQEFFAVIQQALEDPAPQNTE